MSKISVVIPCLDEEEYIANCIESILSCDVTKEDLEILFVDGISGDKTREIILGYIENNPCIKLLDNPQKITPVAMNLGITQAKGEYIFILSAHAKYETNYFSQLIKKSKELSADCVGAVLITEVKQHTKKSNAIKEVLTHKFGVGNASFRTGSDKVLAVDTVAFGCYTKKAFEIYGLFDERLVRNQDIELNKRIVNGGGKIYLIPDIKCTYYARENFTALAKNNYSNGKWNILTAYYTKTFSSLSLRHFIPLFFVLSLLVPFLLSFICQKLLWITFLSLASYLALVIIVSFKVKNDSTSILHLISAFLTLHLSYGTGSLLGIFSVVTQYIKGKV